ncbi:uncharacterized protein TNCV_1156241 [Trichonephila clavipes]|nr:uncharacterized protein TNCV_1156241 [Trichonephila clavipes]
MFDKVSVLLDCCIVSSEEFVTVNDDNVCTVPIIADKDILKFVKSSKNIIEADSGEENEMNKAASFPASSEMKNIMKKELTTEELQETQRNVSPSEQKEDERGPMPTSAIKDIFKKWADVRAMVLEWHPNQADVSMVESSYLALSQGKNFEKPPSRQSTVATPPGSYRPANRHHATQQNVQHHFRHAPHRRHVLIWD